MINDLWSVIIDLFWFAVGRTSPTESTVAVSVLPPRLPVATLREPLASVLLSAPSEPVTEKPHLHSSHPSVLSSPVVAETAVVHPLHEPTVMYVCNQDGTPCLRTPIVDLDSVQLIVPYGAAVTVAAYQGRYARVLHGSFTGYVFKDDLTPQKQAVWPELKEWVIYQADSTEVEKIRALVGRTLGSGASTLPLQAGEYILLRLRTENRLIAWPENRPQLPGNWQTVLKGVSGIHSTILPRTSSVMEWQTETDGGRLAFVESVSPDNTITVTSVGLVMAGQYTRQTWTQSEWRELRPVFITVD